MHTIFPWGLLRVPAIPPHLAAEVAEVLGMLADLHLLDDLTQGGTVPRAVLADNADLLGALGLHARPCMIAGSSAA